jgi:glycosyltransferase involved in cell wall biosynthesis
MGDEQSHAGRALRVLYSSNIITCKSGYGVQGASLLPRLAELPEIGGRSNIAQFAWYGLQGSMLDYDGFRIYPAGVDPYGNDIIGAHSRDFAADVVITLIDVWVLKQTAKNVAPAKWLPWLPIDHDPVPEVFLDALEGAHLPLTYSKWGHERLAAAGVKNVYIPHGVEPTVFRVNADAEQVQAFRQEKLRGVEHLTVMVAANKGLPDRKAFQVQLRAWARFAQDKPGAKIYVHTEPSTRFGGLDLPALAANLGISEKIFFPNQYEYSKGMSAEYLAMMYNAADVFLGAAMAEGFGIPIIEAQACGTPVIVTDFSAMPELVRWGFKVAPRDMIWSPLNAWQAWPDVDGIVEALEELYAQWHAQGDRWELRQRLWAQDQIHAEYGWDTIVAQQWAPLMGRLAGELRPQAPVPGPVIASPAPSSSGGGKLVRVGPPAAVIDGEWTRHD